MIINENVLDVASQYGGAAPGLVTTYDKSRYHNDGTLSIVTWTQLGNGLWVMDFDGNSSYVDCGNDISLYLGYTLTVLVWCYTPLGWTPSSYDGLVVRASGGAPFDGYWLGVDADSKWKAWVGDISDEVISIPSFVTDAWHLVALNADGTNFWVEVDMVEVIGPTAHGVVSTEISTLRIGRSIAATEVWGGYISKTKIFNYALTPAQKRAYYHKTKWLFGVPL